ncbi:MAG: bifunctional methylenetetrahydrofolate dehydrogenase/methenyltetrahydrofolate cyclohydrolase FolD [Gammaproteobacteria bacterium]|nr:bifunctional methylenetetrahydrofolate dehydrogenase/methenyltetrahydrofolate cyclohydrolase FolD [Gammaproteobacteria bacterium]
MTAQILDGKKLAIQLRKIIGSDVKALKQATGHTPGLAVILVGDDPASELYVKHKRNDCDNVGFKSDFFHLPSNTTQRQLQDQIDILNADPTIDGILVQLPLPKQIDSSRIIDRIDPNKDVDGFHPHNIGLLTLRRPKLRPATPKGIMQLLEQTNINFKNINATIIGASNHVGRPMGLELLLAGATVTTAHKFTKDTRRSTREADLLISAVGKPGLVKSDWIKPGAIIVDVGITRDAKGLLHGDVSYDEAREIASWITPVPGGVGPMTRVAMLQNTLMAAKKLLK